MSNIASPRCKTLGLALGLTALLGGCATTKGGFTCKEYAVKQGLIDSAIGAVAGGTIGAASAAASGGKVVVGAAVGAGLGALAGGVAGGVQAHDTCTFLSQSVAGTPKVEPIEVEPPQKPKNCRPTRRHPCPPQAEQPQVITQWKIERLQVPGSIAIGDKEKKELPVEITISLVSKETTKQDVKLVYDLMGPNSNPHYTFGEARVWEPNTKKTLPLSIPIQGGKGLISGPYVLTLTLMDPKDQGHKPIAEEKAEFTLHTTTAAGGN